MNWARQTTAKSAFLERVDSVFMGVEMGAVAFTLGMVR